MANVRSLQFKIGYDINDKPIKDADKAVDKYKDSVKKTEVEQTKLGQKTKETGDKAKAAGKRSTTAAKQSNAAYKKLNTTLLGIGTSLGVVFGFHEVKRGLETVIGLGGKLEEETAKFSVVFGEQTAAARQWSQEYANAVGRSVDETRMFLAENQNMLVGFGATRSEAFKMSKEIQSLGVDLASFNNLADADVLSRMTSAMLGNHLAAKRLGVALTEVTLGNEALRLGYKRNFKDLDPLVKMQIRFNVMLNQSKDSIGDAERTQGSYVNQLKRMKGEFSDAFARVGRDVLPQLALLIKSVNDNKDAIVSFVTLGVNIAVVAMEGFNKVVVFSIDNQKILLPLLGALVGGFAAFKILTGITALIAAFNLAMAVTTTMTGAALGPLAAFNALLIANPIGLVVIGIGALIAAGIALWQNWDVVVAKIGQAWDWLANKWEDVKDIFTFGDTEVSANLVDRRTRSSGANTGRRPNTARGFANGTNGAPAGLAMINEQDGNEMINFNGGEKVYTAGQTKDMLRGGNTSVAPEINITIHGGSDSGETIAQKVRNEVTRVFSEMGTKEGLVWPS